MLVTRRPEDQVAETRTNTENSASKLRGLIMTREDKNLYVRMRILQILLEFEALEHQLSTEELEGLLMALDKTSRDREWKRQTGSNGDTSPSAI